MAITLAKSQQEIQAMPLVELACEVLKAGKEPIYFRDLMQEIQNLRGMSSDDAMGVIARLYTEINMDGRFVCVGQNVWGLKRWYPIDKSIEKPATTSKRFVRRSTGDAFSDEDDDTDYEEDSDDSADEEEELLPLDVVRAEEDDDEDEEVDLTPDEDDAEDFDEDDEDAVVDDEEVEAEVEETDDEDTSDDQDEEY